jgi:uncharacterized membrane protein
MFELPASLPKRIALLVLAAFYVAAGVNHFANPDFYVRIMPPYIPFHLELVHLTGVLEILAGAGVLVARTRRLAGYGIVAMLIAFLPVHVYMAMHPERFAHMASPWALYARLPLQAVLIAWADWATREDSEIRVAAVRR